MFPDVDGEYGGLAAGEWGLGVAGFDDFEFAGFDDEPGPAAAELGGGCVFEFGFEGVEAAEVGVNGFGEGFGWGAAAVRGEAVPVEGVVPGLCGVVEDACFGGVTGNGADDLFEAHGVELGAGYEVVVVGDVGGVVFAVVESEGVG